MRFAWRAGVIVVALIAAGLARAQDFPAGRMTVVVAFSAGGPVDVVARVFADKLAQRWGVPVTVENRTGAGGNIAAALVAKAAPDGHTILFTATGVAINQSLSANPGFAIEELSPRRQSLAEAADFLQSELASWNRMVGAIGLKSR